MHRLPRRLLLVDENSDDREHIARLLSLDATYRYDTVGASSVREGLEASERSSFDVVIVDWCLPDGTGLDVVGALRAGGNLLPVIVVTRGRLEERYEEALQHGVHDVIGKDELDAKRIGRTIEQAIVRARVERGLARAREAELAALAREREARYEAELSARRAARTKEALGNLHVLGEAFAPVLTVADVCRVWRAHTSVFPGALGGTLFLRDGECLVLHSHFGFSESELASWQRLDLNLRTPLTEAARRGEQICIPSSDDFRNLFPGHAVNDAQAWIATPLHTDDTVVGVIGLRYTSSTFPSADDRLFIVMVAERVTQALIRARLFDEASSRAAFERRLLAMIGHDLRTPLSAVTLAAKSLRRQLAEHPVLDRLERSAARMQNLIDDVLSRSQASAHAQQDVALESVVQDQVEELRTAFPGRAIQYTVDGAPLLMVSPSAVGQIVANLVRNALQHGREGEPVQVKLTDAGVPQLHVENRGPTIPADELSELFNPFRRGKTAVGKGSGLGLFIVRENAAALGCALEVFSADGVTRFTVRFEVLETRDSRLPSEPI